MSEQQEEEATRLDISPVLGQILAMMPIPMAPISHGACWQLVPIEENGKKVIVAVLALTTGNGLQAYWVGPNDMVQFVQQAQEVLNALIQENQKINPLVVASQGQMNEVLANKRQMDSQILRK